MSKVTNKRSVKPVSYEISLYNLELSGSFSFQGTVKIKLKIKAASKQIILNAHQLSIHSAEISGTEIECELHLDCLLTTHFIKLM